MLLRCSLLLLMITPLHADPPNDEVRISDEGKLLGKWSVVRVVRSGKQLPANHDLMKAIFEFQKDKVLIHDSSPPGKAETAVYHLNPVKLPAHIDFRPGNGAKDVVKGIYEFEGGKLKMCWSKNGGGRPKSFDDGETKNAMFVVLKRAK